MQAPMVQSEIWKQRKGGMIVKKGPEDPLQSEWIQQVETDQR